MNPRCLTSAATGRGVTTARFLSRLWPAPITRGVRRRVSLMQRDMDLVRKILVKIAEHSSAQAPRVLEIEGHLHEEIVYHCALLIDAGFLEGSVVTDRGALVEPAIDRLTWDGHEFLDAAREPTRWEEAKAKLAKIDGASFTVLLELLKDMARRQLGL